MDICEIERLLSAKSGLVLVMQLNDRTDVTLPVADEHGREPT